MSTTLYELIREGALLYGNRMALICDSESVTYAGLLHLVDDRAGRLPKQLKAVVMPVRTDVESVVALLACAKRGICVMPLPFVTPPEEQLRLAHELFREHPDELPFLLLRTSGTTGDPKLIMLSQETKVLRASQFRSLYGVSKGDHVLVGTPLHYSMPLRLVFASLLYGATARLLPLYSPKLWLEAAKQCTVVVGVPQQLGTLEDAALPAARVILSTSATREDFYQSGLYWDCYGTSEIAIATTFQPLLDELNNVGYAAPGAALRIAEDGEIQVKTPLVFDGYYKNPLATGAAFTADGYFRTGDAGCIGDNGALHLLGRLDDMIKVGGVGVHPETVEAVANKMAGVVECAAVGVPDEQLGEHVHVVLVFDFKTHGQAPTLRQVQHACQGWLAPAEIPRSLSFAESLPRTENGKLLRRKLK